MKNLVTIQDKQVVTTSLAVADGCQLTHQAVIKLVRKYKLDFNEFGSLRFEISKSGGRDTEFAILNEDQATYLITLFRNTDIVRRFKIELVKAFRRAINQLGKLRKSDPDFKAARVNSKAVQRTMTDMLKRVREEDGKETKAHHYSNEMLLVNMIFSGKREPLDRDDLTPPQLKRLSAIVSENIWMMCRGISYADRKQRLTAKHQILLAV
jgi:phage regulator Rha-like protein